MSFLCSKWNTVLCFQGASCQLKTGSSTVSMFLFIQAMHLLPLPYFPSKEPVVSIFCSSQSSAEQNFTRRLRLEVELSQIWGIYCRWYNPDSYITVWSAAVGWSSGLSKSKVWAKLGIVRVLFSYKFQCCEQVKIRKIVIQSRKKTDDDDTRYDMQHHDTKFWDGAGGYFHLFWFIHDKRSPRY